METLKPRTGLVEVEERGLTNYTGNKNIAFHSERFGLLDHGVVRVDGLLKSRARPR